MSKSNNTQFNIEPLVIEIEKVIIKEVPTQTNNITTQILILTYLHRHSCGTRRNSATGEIRAKICSRVVPWRLHRENKSCGRQRTNREHSGKRVGSSTCPPPFEGQSWESSGRWVVCLPGDSPLGGPARDRPRR